ncbi:MAG: hypothetical protein NDJ89_16325 [Oligoflexia bacterium]|nr:hypothetical protein [Oligoflexia bacterium]
MANKGGNCWNCGAELTALDYGRSDTCRKCGRDTKTCKGCEHFDPMANNQCHENQAERVLEKERSNFCDYFRPRAGSGASAASRDAMKSAAEALFKKK